MSNELGVRSSRQPPTRSSDYLLITTHSLLPPLLDLRQLHPRLHQVSLADVNGADDSGARRADRVLHLHRLEHQEHLAALDLVARGDGRPPDAPRHGSAEVAAVLARAGGARRASAGENMQTSIAPHEHAIAVPGPRDDVPLPVQGELAE